MTIVLFYLIVVLHATPPMAEQPPPSPSRTAAAHIVKKRRKKPALKRAASQRNGWPVAISAVRHAMLHDFLVETGTESPAFVDRHVAEIAGVRIGPTSVDTDFLGSPIVRATVVNVIARDVHVLLRADVEDAKGRIVHGSIWVELHPSTSRAIEVLCPGTSAPISVRWSGIALGDP